VIALHLPAIAGHLRRVERLDETLRGAAASLKPESAQAMSDLVDTVTVHPPGENRTPMIDVQGISADRRRCVPDGVD